MIRHAGLISFFASNGAGSRRNGSFAPTSQTLQSKVHAQAQGPREPEGLHSSSAFERCRKQDVETPQTVEPFSCIVCINAARRAYSTSITLCQCHRCLFCNDSISTSYRVSKLPWSGCGFGLEKADFSRAADPQSKRYGCGRYVEQLSVCLSRHHLTLRR